VDPEKILAAKIAEALKQEQVRELLARGDRFIVEDVGLQMSCFGIFPGSFIKWYLKYNGSKWLADEAELHKDYGATAMCTLCYYDGSPLSFQGMKVGTIVQPRKNGEGFDPIFVPEYDTKAFSEMTVEEKTAKSHRGVAFNKLKKFLEI
jgi:XTP/dITP diphosphohydrolase